MAREIKRATYTVLPIGKRAKIHNVWLTGVVYCKKYTGDFRGGGLQSKAAAGSWYTGISGNPHSVQGGGHTPTWAVKDAINRNLDKIKKLAQANVDLEQALEAIKENPELDNPS